MESVSSLEWPTGPCSHAHLKFTLSWEPLPKTARLRVDGKVTEHEGRCTRSFAYPKLEEIEIIPSPCAASFHCWWRETSPFEVGQETYKKGSNPHSNEPWYYLEWQTRNENNTTSLNLMQAQHVA